MQKKYKVKSWSKKIRANRFTTFSWVDFLVPSPGQRKRVAFAASRGCLYYTVLYKRLQTFSSRSLPGSIALGVLSLSFWCCATPTPRLPPYSYPCLLVLPPFLAARGDIWATDFTVVSAKLFFKHSNHILFVTTRVWRPNITIITGQPYSLSSLSTEKKLTPGEW